MYVTLSRWIGLHWYPARCYRTASFGSRLSWAGYQCIVDPFDDLQSNNNGILSVLPQSLYNTISDKYRLNVMLRGGGVFKKCLFYLNIQHLRYSVQGVFYLNICDIPKHSVKLFQSQFRSLILWISESELKRNQNGHNV